MSTFPVTGQPAPVADEDSAQFWRGLREHRILLQRCAVCDHVRCPPLPACPQCGAGSSEVVPATGRGRIYSWITVRRPMGTLTAEDVPRTIVTVELEEGCRLLGRLDPTGKPDFDRAVTPQFVDRNDWTELGFQIDGDAVR